MKYIVQDAEGKKMIMSVVSSMPQLPEGFQVLGKAEELPEAMDEIEAASQEEALKAEAAKFLKDTDWKVIRHRDQVEMGVPTSMTAEEFAQLLADRQAARDLI